ncbi:TRAP-type mannitol/chloroaromatic compound transport system, small permease component [Desulfacinum infernum DSM 9756]|uniref:TRAP-type mannitol/chloroaromatic compound transport system, small permease component n=1 Tax=Desulfacinum infernum DSM 9756 TaxID=1121391 RepID=A0A1M5GLW9_9BACT|nr:TRAP transporter small permease subunit [Desulfacinum infernum]SHG04512.1 TRAP-type mannitol/chloroaromatic compound transport system, small permease component [Desulfacinum infernum DSM 9756]
MHWISRFCDRLDSVNRAVGRGVSWVALLMVLVVTVDVIMRYLFKITFVFVQELEWHLFGVLFLIGAGYTLLYDDHVRVDVFYQRFSKKTQAWINFLGALLALFPGCYLIIVTSWQFVMNSWAVNEGSPDPGGLPARYILKAMIPIGFALVALQGIPLTLRSLMVILGIESDFRPERKEGAH